MSGRRADEHGENAKNLSQNIYQALPSPITILGCNHSGKIIATPMELN